MRRAGKPAHSVAFARVLSSASPMDTGGESRYAASLAAAPRGGSQPEAMTMLDERYIGDGKVVHASNERTGIIVSTWNYRDPVAIKNMMNYLQ